MDLNVTEVEEDEDAVVQSESDERVVALFRAWDNGWVSETSESAGEQDGEEQSVDSMALGNLEMQECGAFGRMV